MTLKELASWPVPFFIDRSAEAGFEIVTRRFNILLTSFVSR